MNKRKITALILSAVLIVSALPGAINAQSAGFSENFESMTVGIAPQSNSYDLSCFAGSGDIVTRESDGNKYVSIENPDEGFPVMLRCSFEELSGAISAGARFRQSEKSDGNVIMRIMSGDTTVCSVETKDGDIVFKQSTGVDLVIVENYATDTWYEIRLELVSNTDTADVYVNDVLYEIPEAGEAAQLALFTRFAQIAPIADDEGFQEEEEEDSEIFEEDVVEEEKEKPKVNIFTSVNELRAIASSYPGFEMDDVYVRPSGVVATVEIDGADIMSIPPEGQTQTYTYTATAFSGADEEITASFNWTVSPSDSNVTLNTVNEKTAELTVSSTAAENTEYTLTATANGEVKSRKKITVKRAAFDKIEIRGKGSISPALEKVGNTYEYTAAIYDEFGNEMHGESVTWELSGEGSGYFSLNPASGVLTVTKTADVTSYINIRATITGSSENAGKYADRKVSLVDLRSYLSDETRRNAIKTYMDTALEFGKDIYLGTPRIADGINRDGEPIKWRVQSRDEIPIADIGNEWELLRTMIAYSDIMGDPYYKERAYELYRWTMEHDVSDNGLIYWGSHRAVDMRTGGPTNIDTVTGIGRYHEIEEKDMYFTPFYEIDEEKTAQLVKNIWMGHVIETTDENKNVLGWTDLMFNRHAEYTKTIDEAFQTATWDNVDIYDEEYYLKDPFIRTKESKSPFFLAGSEYISAAVELYNKTGDETALTWARRLAERYANLADKKTGVFPCQISTPYGVHDIVDENGDLSFNTRPAWVNNYTKLPSGMGAKKYGDQLYVQFAEGMEEEGLLDGYDVEEHLPLPSKCCEDCRVGYHGSCDGGCNDITVETTDTAETIAKKRDNKCRAVLRERIIADGAKALILDMYYYRNWPWAYGKSGFSIMELVEALGLESTEDDGFELFAKWVHGYNSYIGFAYEGNARIKVSFACGANLDGYVTKVPGSTSNKGSSLDKTVIDMEPVLPAVEALSMLSRFGKEVEVYDGANGGDKVTVGDVEQTLWGFINSMADYYGLGYLGEGRAESFTAPEPDYHTTCDDANALNVVLELYQMTQRSEFLRLARIIANNIVTNQYSGGLFIPEDQYGTWTTSYIAAVLMKLDAIINNTWSEALDFSFQSYVYHQAYYIDEHGKIPSKQHESRYEESYTDVLAKKILINADYLTMQVGDARELEIMVLPDDAGSKGYYWEISDQSVVQADGNVIYAVGKGEAVIRAVINNTDVESADIHITVE